MYYEVKNLPRTRVDNKVPPHHRSSSGDRGPLSPVPVSDESAGAPVTPAHHVMVAPARLPAPRGERRPLGADAQRGHLKTNTYLQFSP